MALAQSGHLNIAQGTGPENLDVQRTTVQQTLNVAFQINEPLFDLDPVTHELIPRLGLSYEMMDDTTWRVELQQGVSFTNGEEFNANTVQFSILRVDDPAISSPATIYTAPIDNVLVVDEYTVEITTHAAAPTLPLYLTRVGMVPPSYIEEVGNEVFANAPVGTGPFTLKTWVRDDRVELVANPSYWKGSPSLDSVTFLAIPETSTRMAALLTGEADIATQVSIDQVTLLERSGISVEPIPSLRLMMLAFNLETTDPENPIYDTRVRQALNYAIDKDALVSDILEGYGKVAAGQPLSPEYFGYNPDVKGFEYRPEKAKELLAEAGFTPENPLSITLVGPSGRYVRDSEVIQAIGGQLATVGVNVEVNILEWGLFISQLLAKELGELVFWGATTVPDGDVWLSSMLKGGAAYSTYDDPQFDALLDAAATELDPEKREAIYHEAAVYANEQAPFAYLFQLVDIYGISERVSGWSPMPDETIDLWGVTTE